LEDIKNRINNSYRSKIRQADKNGVNTSFSLENINDFFEVYFQTLSKQNKLTESKDYFLTIMKYLPEELIVGVSKISDQLESSIFCMADGKTCYYEYGGTIERTKYSGSNKLLFLRLIEELKENNYSKLILGGYRNNLDLGSKIHGIQTFKLRLGAEIMEGYHFYKVINPTRYYFFQFLLKLKSIITRKNLDLLNFSGLEIKKSK
jgi:lipid II:glycine glycyltransferase (peptidoglycan interpeptide bridge formation enzyme)